jgi:hypothetical protein
MLTPKRAQRFSFAVSQSTRDQRRLRDDRGAAESVARWPHRASVNGVRARERWRGWSRWRFRRDGVGAPPRRPRRSPGATMTSLLPIPVLDALRRRLFRLPAPGSMAGSRRDGLAAGVRPVA